MKAIESYQSLAERAPARRKSPPASHFDITAYEVELLPLLRELEQSMLALPDPAAPLSAKLIQRLLKRYPRAGKGLFSRSQIIAGFRALSNVHPFEVSEREFLHRLRMRPVRSLSGVSPVTVFCKPFPCPGQCIFCPNDVRMPKSYLSDEPGAQRAEDNAFDPYLQTWGRLNVFRAIGHGTDKVELIVLGGTWTHYPESYRRWFIKRCFDAMNDFAAGLDERPSILAKNTFDNSGLPRSIDLKKTNYNAEVPAHRSSHEDCSWTELEKAHNENENSSARCVGLSVETRPDEISEDVLVELRRLGCTKIQLGLQSLDDEVLALNKRGHDVAAARKAAKLVRRYGFKLQAHWMPNLFGSDPEKDKQDFLRLFSDPAFYPDELKIYPCSLIENTELMQAYQDGRWQPYSTEVLCDVLVHVLTHTPRYCRLSRVVRDIPAGDIVTGNVQSNLREAAEAKARQLGKTLLDIRAREIRASSALGIDFHIKHSCYLLEEGTEYFIESLCGNDRVVGFIRIFMPNMACLEPEIANSVMIRELHVYGQAMALGQKQKHSGQHRGVGRTLLLEAEKLAKQAGYRTLSVISAVGTRPYYRRHDFHDGALYQHKML
ncbi:MAG: tRNA uridine(34) 5-carboxymethylaminomethyl modification radical SAM/GNAT enzyme Elp3 [Myxococcales bacterium]|nr:MAG: tRNA uridine(34) 5-carboxymethylaminomethyl modification radical SAM/GNAT enzyme Elp3 [Myxococcales bacterium]